MLCGEPGFVHAEGGGQEGRPVWDGEGGSGRRAVGEVAELGKRATPVEPLRANMAAIVAE